jgi:glycosyltransferase involved in cell wall biosynthesis
MTGTCTGKATASNGSRGHALRLLVVAPAYAPAWAHGGVVRSMSSLCRAMAAGGADVSVYTMDADGEGGRLPVPLGTPVEREGVKVSYFAPTLGRRCVWDSRGLVRRVEQTVGAFDIVYIGEVWHTLGIAVARRAWQRGVPFVIGPHGSFLPAAAHYKRLRKSCYWHLLLQRWVSAAGAIHCTTEYERTASRRFLARTPSFIVPNPLLVSDPEEPRTEAVPDVRRHFGIPADAFLLLTVARVHPSKRVDLLIEALQRIVGVSTDVRLLVVGPCAGSHAAQMRSLAERLGVQRHIVWAGFQTGAMLEGCFRAGDLFVLPSAHENFCNAAAEAMAYGLPVVLSDQVGIAADVKRFDIGVVTELDGGQIAEAVLRLRRAPAQRRQMGTQAARVVRELYDADHVAHLMLQAFMDILQGSRSPECRWQPAGVETVHVAEAVTAHRGIA